MLKGYNDPEVKEEKLPDTGAVPTHSGESAVIVSKKSKNLTRGSAVKLEAPEVKNEKLEDVVMEEPVVVAGNGKGKPSAQKGAENSKK